MRNLLKTERLRLRAVEPEDMDFFYRLENDTSMWVYTHTTVPYSRYAIRRYLEEAESNFFADGTLPLVVELADGTPIGTVDFYDYQALHGRVEMGLVVLEQWRRRGYGMEALSLAVVYVRERLHLHQIYVHVAENNTAARRLFRRAGFCEAAVLPDWYANGGGRYEAACVYSLILSPSSFSFS